MKTLEELQQAYQRDYGKELPIVSGKRTYEQQSKLYQARFDSNLPVAKPGTSKHEIGNAIDLPRGIDSAWMEQQGWYRPHANDPVHWEPRPESKTMTKENKFIYEINGQRVEFDHEPSTEDIDYAAKQLGGTVGESKKDLGKQVAQDLGKVAMDTAKGAGNFVVENPEAAIGAASLYGANKLTGNPIGKTASGVYDVAKGMTTAQKNPQMAGIRQGMAAMQPPGQSLKSLGERIGYQAGQLPGAKIAGRGLAGLGMGLSGLQAIDDYNAGNYGQAALNTAGAIGSGVAMLPHPLAKALGGSVGILGPAAASYLKSLQQ